MRGPVPARSAFAREVVRGIAMGSDTGGGQVRTGCWEGGSW